LKIIFALLICALLCQNNPAQTVEKNSETTVVEITLSRAVDADGNLSEATTVFTAKDIPIYCSLQLSSMKSVAVKMNVVAVSANGLKPNSTVVSVNYKTDGKQDGVSFTASPGREIWAAGKYRVDIMLDGKTARSLEFTIEKSLTKIEKQGQSPPTKVKPKRKPREI